MMSIEIEAIYEAGVFKPITPISNLKEHEKVRLVVESIGLIADQRKERIQIDPGMAREIGESPDYDLFEK
jgi:predicted DNA-binding antitoxin AbrB/MazE fold protein